MQSTQSAFAIAFCAMGATVLAVAHYQTKHQQIGKVPLISESEARYRAVGHHYRGFDICSPVDAASIKPFITAWNEPRLEVESGR
jgi:hypothetical protein